MSTANPIRDEISSALGTDYEIIRELGRGGASVVYLARDRVLGREVAVKVVRDAQSSDPEAIARFEREARTLAALQHPNIVMLYSARQLPGGTLALVMQHGDWTTLKSHIREQGPLPIEAVEQVLRDLASALVYLHRNQVIHRDIKPENIFIEADTGRALLSDFGIAKTAGEARTSVTLTGVVIGTPAYMSPEQIDGGELTGRSDLYSLGMVGYEMLTGTRPWEGENLFGVIYKQKTERLPSLAQVRPDAPEKLRHLIERATEKDPAARWSDAPEFLANLTGTPVVPAAVPVERAVTVSPAPAAPMPAALAPIPASEYPTLEIDQAALATALAEEGRATAKRRRSRRQRFMAAAVVVLIFTGGAGALAFSDRGDPSGTRSERSLAFAAEQPTDPAYMLSLGQSSAEEQGDGAADSLTTLAGDSAASAELSNGNAGRTAVAGVDTRPSGAAVTTPQRTPVRPPAARTGSGGGARVETPPATPRQQANRSGVNITSSTTRPELARAEEEEIRQSPPALIPALSVTRATGTAPRISGGQVLQPQAGARAGAAGAPQLRNRERIQQLLAERYPSDLRARGIGGTSVLTVLVAPDGRVEQSSLVTSSGNDRLDDAAAAIAGRMLFERPEGASGQAVWISVPLTFAAQ